MKIGGKDYRVSSGGNPNAGALQIRNASYGYSVLLIFQAMDAAGKDGAIRHVLNGI